MNSKALPLASQLIADKERTFVAREVVIRHQFRPQKTVVNERCNQRNQDDKGIVLRIMAKIGYLFASIAVGSALVRLSDTKKELNKVHKDKETLQPFEGNFEQSDREFIDGVNEITNLRERICKRIRNSAAWDLALRISLTAALILVAVGAFLSCPPVLGVAVVETIVIGCALLFKWGFDSTDRQNYADAKNIHGHMTALTEQKDRG